MAGSSGGWATTFSLAGRPRVLDLALAGLAAALVLALGGWLASLAYADASLADRLWPWLIVAPALVYAGISDGGAKTLATGALALVLIWALRLSAFITVRNWGRGEDRRYRVMRARHEPGFAWKSGYLVFGLQALLAWVVSAPLLAMTGSLSGETVGVLGVAGLLLAAFGIGFEAIADAQLARFKAASGSKGRVMDRGLWRYSRHPNYFGEACVWWGMFLVASAAGGPAALWSIVSPLLMMFLLLRVSGVKLLEADLASRHPAYRDYVARTSAFIPMPPTAPCARQPGA